MTMQVEPIIAAMISDKMYELEAKGFSADQVDGAIKRARNWATRIAEKIAPDRREAAFLDLFESQLNECEKWLMSVRNSKANWKQGIQESTGVMVGPMTEAAYQEWTK